MKTLTQTIRPAGVAIAAALALSPMALFAQDASVAPTDPAVAAPETAPAPDRVSAPVIEVPLVTDQSASVAAPAPAARTAARSTAAARPAPVRASSRPALVSSVVAAPVTAQAAPVAAAPVVLPEPPIAATVPEASVAPLAQPAVMPAEPQSAFDARLALILGALGALALLAWGFIAAGRRRSSAEAIAVPVIERPIIAERAIAEPEAVAPVHDPIAFAPRPAAPAASLSHSGASVALPKTLPATYDEREALLQRIVDAKPDRANPFTDRHARRRRARLIMQSLGRTFERAPRIDLSQYPENWPELARMNYAAAA